MSRMGETMEEGVWIGAAVTGGVGHLAGSESGSGWVEYLCLDLGEG